MYIHDTPYVLQQLMCVYTMYFYVYTVNTSRGFVYTLCNCVYTLCMPGACARACARAGAWRVRARAGACACGRNAGARAFQLSFGKLFCGNPQESGFSENLCSAA